jgi:probable phosphoglycerate mutase
MSTSLEVAAAAALNRPRSQRNGVLRYLRHGLTEPNLAHVRCGGDLDVPLLEQGREQVAEAARELVYMDPPIGLIISSDLRRTRESARIIAAVLGDVDIQIVPAFAERQLGEWNLLGIEETQPWLDAGMDPPGGETDADFTHRVARALHSVRPLLHLHPLLVGSKGVARVMGNMVGLPRRLDLGNAQVAEFKLAELPCLETTWGTV